MHKVDILHRPRAILLRRLLQHPCATDVRWVQAVLASYTEMMVEELSPSQQAALERTLVQTVGELAEQAQAAVMLRSLVDEARADAEMLLVPRMLVASLRHTQAAGARNSDHGDLLRMQLMALRYFTCMDTLRTAAAVHLALEGVAAGRASLRDIFHAVPHSPAQFQLVCLAALIPLWGVVISRLSGRSNEPMQHCSTSTARTTANRDVTALVCAAMRDQPALLLQVNPALPAEACRTSLLITQAFVAAAREVVTNNSEHGSERMRECIQHACKYNDHVSDYVRTALSGTNLL